MIKKENFTINLLRPIFRVYVKIFNPSLIVDSYLGIQNSIKNFVFSFGKVLCIPSKFFFHNEIKIKKNNILRSKINVKERDQIDKFFNILIKDYLPSSFVENFKFHNLEAQKFKNLPVGWISYSSN